MDRTINIKIPCMNDLFRHNGKWSSQVSFVFDAAAFLLLVCGWTESRLAAGPVPGSVQKSLTILQEKEIPDPWQRLCLYRLKNSQTYPLINKSATFTAKKNKNLCISAESQVLPVSFIRGVFTIVVSFEPNENRSFRFVSLHEGWGDIWCWSGQDEWDVVTRVLGTAPILASNVSSLYT